MSNNPWENIDLFKYEKHMELDDVKQLQTMNKIMYNQFYDYKINSLMILGIAGGNGLNHIDPNKIKKVYGVDINEKYLKECTKRYPDLQNTFFPLHADLLSNDLILPHADLVIANLLIEYIGYDNFKKSIKIVCPSYVSCVIQVNIDESFVSNSPYLHIFDHLDEVHHNIDEKSLTDNMKEINYNLILNKKIPCQTEKCY